MGDVPMASHGQKDMFLSLDGWPTRLGVGRRRIPWHAHDGSIYIWRLLLKKMDDILVLDQFGRQDVWGSLVSREV